MSEEEIIKGTENLIGAFEHNVIHGRKYSINT